MATAKIAYRRSAAGIAVGLGAAMPLAAYAATFTFRNLNDAVVSSALPFVAGISAGVGIHVLAGHLIEKYSTNLEDDSMVAAEPKSIAAPVAESVSYADDVRKGFTGMFKHDRAGVDNDVPVIARAQATASEMEPWIGVDASMSVAPSAYSTYAPAAQAQDPYEIALEELRAAERQRMLEESDRKAAMQTLYGGSAASVRQPIGTIVMEELDEPELALESSLDSSLSANAQAQPVAAAPVMEASSADVPVADYSGHENMWAAALSILDDESAFASSVSSTSDNSAAQAMPQSVSQTCAIPSEQMAQLAHDASLEAADKDKQNEIALENHVNELIEEVFNRASAANARSSSHDHLEVVDGGTSSFPAVKQA